MKKQKLYLLIVLLLSLICLSSCIRFSGNSINYYRIEIIDDFTFSNVKIDTINKSYKLLTNSNDTIMFSDYIVEGGTAPRYGIDIKEGYENIEDDILGLNTLDEKSVIYTIAYLKGNYVYGICNVYYQTIGYLSGGGNYGEEEIAYSIYYKYDKFIDTIEILCRIDNGTMIAFYDDYVVYWKDKVFYSYSISNDLETKLCDHVAYDSGLLHQSVTNIFFDDKYVIIQMKKAGYFNAETYYIYLYEYGKEVIELHQEE